MLSNYDRKQIEDPQTYIIAGLLGSLGDKAKQLSARVKPEMFSNPDYSKIFQFVSQGVKDLSQLREVTEVSAATVADLLVISSEIWLTKKDVDYFVEQYYQDKVKDLVYNNKISEVQKVITQMQEEESTDVIRQYESYKKEMRELADTGLLGFSTGLKRLDYTTKGLIQGQIWVIGAYYGYGKTYVLLNLIRSAIKQNKRVLFFSLEMNSTEIIARLVGMDAKLDALQVFQTLMPRQHEKRMQAEEFWLQAIAQEKLVIVDDVRTADDIMAIMISEESKGHLDMVGIDYLQLLATGMEQYEALREAMKTMQMITKKIKCCTVMLSQINNQAQREGQNSKVDGFKGAGDIGQVANVAIKLGRQKDSETGEWNKQLGLNVTKVRHGFPRILEMEFEFPGGNIVDKLSEFEDEEKE